MDAREFETLKAAAPRSLARANMLILLYGLVLVGNAVAYGVRFGLWWGALASLGSLLAAVYVGGGLLLGRRGIWWVAVGAAALLLIRYGIGLPAWLMFVAEGGDGGDIQRPIFLAIGLVLSAATLVLLLQRSSRDHCRAAEAPVLATRLGGDPAPAGGFDPYRVPSASLDPAAPSARLAVSPALEGPPPPLPAVDAPPPRNRGSVRVCRLLGTDVYLHWTFFAAAYFLIDRNQDDPYSSYAWDVAEYLLGFGLILAHEFGHVLACRSVGGSANRVVLWPLGGLAFVAPPPRPGATFWTIAAGPLVNVVAFPVLLGLAVATFPGDDGPRSDVNHLITALGTFNGVILIFNLLPIFPLDGGRILQSALWPLFGRVAGLAVAAGIGLVGSLGLGIAVLTLAGGGFWLAAMVAFLGLGAVGGITHSRTLARLKHAGRRPGLACPNRHAAPPVGHFWRCTRCLRWFDLFDPEAPCPKGANHATDAACIDCGQPLGLADWWPTPPAAVDAAATAVPSPAHDADGQIDGYVRDLTQPVQWVGWWRDAAGTPTADRLAAVLCEADGSTLRDLTDPAVRAGVARVVREDEALRRAVAAEFARILEAAAERATAAGPGGDPS